jgi:hypothetical protein
MFHTLASVLCKTVEEPMDVRVPTRNCETGESLSESIAWIRHVAVTPLSVSFENGRRENRRSYALSLI